MKTEKGWKGSAERENAKGMNLFNIQNVNTKKSIWLNKNEFFKEFDLFKDAMSPEALRKKYMVRARV